MARGRAGHGFGHRGHHHHFRGGGGRGYNINGHGLSSGFRPRNANQPSTTNVFKYQSTSRGFYLNPFLGKEAVMQNIRNLSGDCCPVGGSCVDEHNISQRVSCYLSLFAISAIGLIIVNIINLLNNASDRPILRAACSVQIAVNSLMLLLNNRLYSNRKDIFSAQCLIILFQLFAPMLTMFVTGSVISLSIVSHTDEDPKTSENRWSNEPGPWTTESTLVLITGISTIVVSLKFLWCSGCGITNWLASPFYLADQDQTISLEYPVFAVDTSSNSIGIQNFVQLITQPITSLDQNFYRFSYDPIEQIQLMGALRDQRNRMINELNAIVGGTGGVGFLPGGLAVQQNIGMGLNPIGNQGTMANPALNPYINQVYLGNEGNTNIPPNPMMDTAYPTMNIGQPIVAQPQAPVEIVPQLSPLITEDVKYQKLREINERLLGWKGTLGFYEIGSSVNNQNQISFVNGDDFIPNTKNANFVGGITMY